ncbi:MAG: transcriptional repressor NrdR [bacterium]|nr:transcriptional repressor NrdR [bacterium]MCP5044749.1 transcriptional repressor NrdR [bacterium]
MRCPFCGDEENKVIDTRLAKDGEEIRRRRECEECGRRFTTRERLETVLPRVIKHDSRREDYDRDKLRSGIEAACVKRPVSADAIERLIDAVERTIHEGGEKEVPSRAIGEQTMRGLIELDHLAAVRFASVFRNFESGEDYDAFFAKLEDEQGAGS